MSEPGDVQEVLLIKYRRYFIAVAYCIISNAFLDINLYFSFLFLLMSKILHLLLTQLLSHVQKLKDILGIYGKLIVLRRLNVGITLSV
jgi:uncharacterized membrane protein YagU involved in acid resistance